MAIDFPTSPTLNQIYAYGSKSWIWNGTSWDIYPTSSNIVSSFNGLTGAVTGVSSVNGVTGAVTNIAKTNVNNNFSASQTISASGPVLTVSDSVLANFSALNTSTLQFYNDVSAATQVLQSNTTASSSTITLPGNSTTLSGLSLAQTFTALQNFSAGISAAGATFSGTINLNGQTFTNLVQSLNGFTGTVGAWLNNPGFTTAAQTWNDGTSNGVKTIYYIPTNYVNPGDWGSYIVDANRAYFTLFNTSKPLTIKTIRALTNSTVTTGNAFISVYSANVNTGMPSTRLYNSASLAVGSGFGGISVTNASGLVTVPAGFFYVSTIFSSTPTMFAFQRYKIPHIYGASSYSSGTYNIMPLADYSGFTTASQLPVAGVTLGFLEATAGNYTGVVVEIAI